MTNKYLKKVVFILTTCLMMYNGAVAQVGIGTVDPHASSILDIQATDKGVLFPRMTSAQRDAISAPAPGLMVFNTTTNTEDVFNSTWKSLSYAVNASSNLVYVYSIADLPVPVSANINLDGTKMYVFSGFVNISPNYITVNGAGLKGTDPQKDGILSTVNGAILRSVDKSVFIQDLAIIPFSATTSAFNVSDTTGQMYFNSFSGASVVEIPLIPGGAVVTSAGVGQISGFKAITILKNLWKVSNGVKLTGTIGKFTSVLNFVEGISSGNAAVEILAGATISDIDMANNYFIYTGNIGVKVNVGAIINRARMTTNMFRGVTTPLTGIDSYSSGWSMKQNSGIPDSRAYSFLYFNNNTTATTFDTQGTYVKIAGTTLVVNQKRFSSTANRITYNNVESIVATVSVVMSAKAPANGSDFSIGIAKNGVILPIASSPRASMAGASNNQSFQITLNTEVDLAQNDYIEVWITRNNLSSATLIVDELQFRVTD